MQLDNFLAKGASGLKIRVGEVVFIHNKHSKRLMWKTGVVKELLPSWDRLFWSAIVQFPNGNLLIEKISYRTARGPTRRCGDSGRRTGSGASWRTFSKNSDKKTQRTQPVGFVNYICIIAYSSNDHGAQFLLCIQGSWATHPPSAASGNHTQVKALWNADCGSLLPSIFTGVQAWY